MLRGGTVVLLSGPRSSFFMPQSFPGVGLDGSLDRSDEDTLDRALSGPSVFGPPLHM